MIALVLSVAAIAVAIVAFSVSVALSARYGIGVFAQLERERRVDDDKLAALREEVVEVHRKVDRLGTQQGLGRRS